MSRICGYILAAPSVMTGAVCGAKKDPRNAWCAVFKWGPAMKCNLAGFWWIRHIRSKSCGIIPLASAADTSLLPGCITLNKSGCPGFCRGFHPRRFLPVRNARFRKLHPFSTLNASTAFAPVYSVALYACAAPGIYPLWSAAAPARRCIYPPAPIKSAVGSFGWRMSRGPGTCQTMLRALAAIFG